MTCTVYGLRSSASPEIRYVGQTRKSPSKRYTVHLNDAENPARNTALSRWIRDEWRAGRGIMLVILERNAVWNDAEKRLIAELAAAGCRLVNVRAGGTWGNRDPDRVAAVIGARKRLAAARNRTGRNWGGASEGARRSARPA